MEIMLFKDQSLKGYTLIEGFPGIGLVGPMAGSYLIEKLKMDYIGYLRSEMFPPIAAVHNGVPMFPARIYKNEEYKLVLFIAEFTIPAAAIRSISGELLAFARKYGINRLVSVGGMPASKPTEDIFMVSNDPSALKKVAKLGINPIDEGVVAGVSAELLVNSQALKLPVMDILVEVDPSITNPKYAELAITGLNKLLDIDIDLSELDKEAKEVEEKIKEMMKKVKDSHEHYSGGEETGPSMYA
jgi:uncharacterized protein